MKFYPVLSEYIFEGDCLLKNNNIYFLSSNFSDKTIQFGGWNQELNVDWSTKKLVSFEAIFSNREMVTTKLDPPSFQKACITVDRIEKTKPLMVYHDNDSGWFCFGDKDCSGNGYCFATNTIAVIYENEIYAIYIRPDVLDI